MKSNIVGFPKAPKLTIHMVAVDLSRDDEIASYLSFDIDNDFLVRLDEFQAQAEVMDASITFKVRGGNSLDSRDKTIDITIDGRGRIEPIIRGHRRLFDVVGTGQLTVDLVRQGLGVCEGIDEREGVGFMLHDGANLIIFDRNSVNSCDDGEFSVKHDFEPGEEPDPWEAFIATSKAILL